MKKDASKSFLKTALFCLLTLCIALSGVFGSRLFSRLLPDLTGQVLSGYLPQSPQNAFFLGEGSDIAIYPWDQYHPEECVSLSDITDGGDELPSPSGAPDSNDAPAMGEAMEDVLWEMFPDEVGKADLEEKIQYSESRGMFYLSELETKQGTVSMALGPRCVSYFHIDLDEGYRQPSSSSNVSARQALEEFRMRTTAAAENPGGASEDSLGASSVAESESDEVPAVEDGDPSYNGLAQFVSYYCWLEGAIWEKYAPAWLLSREELYDMVLTTLLDGTVSTLSQDGETLVSLSLSGYYYNELSMVLFYDEESGCFTGISLKVYAFS